ncbi:MAG: ferrochelatase [Acidobacteria bacterium]|nr:ferrochelatase [Acidobacteriota bacterium]
MNPRTGVLLLNFGGPEKLEEVRPFLYQLFADPDVIRIPTLLREPLARLISMLREKKSQSYYRRIGGGSPIRRITEEQGRALASLLKRNGHDFGVYVGMQCWHPFIDATVETIRSDGISRLIVLPLFPQYSVTTTGACLAKLEKALGRFSPDQRPSMTIIRQWHDHPLYVQTLAGMILEALDSACLNPVMETHVLFSAHGIPERYVKQGDPYVEQTRSTVELVMDRLGRRFPYQLTFQSRLGPVRWIRPYTDEVIGQLGRSSVRRILVVPISFVSEHVETLYEIDVLYKELAARSGIEDFRRVPALNLRPDFIGCLVRLVEERLVEDSSAASPAPRSS